MSQDVVSASKMRHEAPAPIVSETDASDLVGRCGRDLSRALAYGVAEILAPNATAGGVTPSLRTVLLVAGGGSTAAVAQTRCGLLCYAWRPGGVWTPQRSPRRAPRSSGASAQLRFAFVRRCAVEDEPLFRTEISAVCASHNLSSCVLAWDLGATAAGLAQSQPYGHRPAIDAPRSASDLMSQRVSALTRNPRVALDDAETKLWGRFGPRKEAHMLGAARAKSVHARQWAPRGTPANALDAICASVRAPAALRSVSQGLG